MGWRSSSFSLVVVRVEMDDFQDEVEEALFNKDWVSDVRLATRVQKQMK